MEKTLLFLAFCLSNLIGFSQNLDVVGNINTKGKIQINGNSGTAGQVLMSNGNSSPAWTTVSSTTCATGGKFLMLTKNQTSATGDFDVSLNALTTQDVIIKYHNVQYNTNSDVSIVPSTGIITCNRTGLYYFEGMIRYSVTSSHAQSPRANIFYQIGEGTPIFLNEEKFTQVNNINYSISIPFRMIRYLTAGQTIKFSASILNLDTNPAISSMGILFGSSVSGYFISE